MKRAKWLMPLLLLGVFCWLVSCSSPTPSGPTGPEDSALISITSAEFKQDGTAEFFDGSEFTLVLKFENGFVENLRLHVTAGGKRGLLDDRVVLTAYAPRNVEGRLWYDFPSLTVPYYTDGPFSGPLEKIYREVPILTLTGTGVSGGEITYPIYYFKLATP